MLSRYVPPGRVVEEHGALQVSEPDDELDPYYRTTADFKSMYGFDETVLLDLCLQLFVVESRNVCGTVL
jgi:hypothetical protein